MAMMWHLCVGVSDEWSAVRMAMMWHLCVGVSDEWSAVRASNAESRCRKWDQKAHCKSSKSFCFVFCVPAFKYDTQTMHGD